MQRPQKKQTMANQKKAAPAKKAAKKTATKKAVTSKRSKGSLVLKGAVAAIIALAAKGKTPTEIIAAGYNKSTVYRQYKRATNTKTKSTKK